jgi:pyridoxine/pyridoxamine 5'-phosphate oxidase
MSDEPEQILADCWRRLQTGREQADHPFRTAALATADALGRPDVRTIVLRHVDSQARTLDFQTDRRSPKFDTLHRNASAAWLFYDAGDKLQLRIQTTAVPHTHDEVADSAWASAPDAGKQQYFSAVPSSEPIDSPAASQRLEAGRVNFAVVRCLVESMEWLRLVNGQWRRVRFTWPSGGVKWQWLAP